MFLPLRASAAEEDVTMPSSQHTIATDLSAFDMPRLLRCFVVTALLGRKVGGIDLQAIGVERPIVRGVDLAESILGLLLGFPVVAGIKLDGSLADLVPLAVVAQDVLDEADDEARHGCLCTVVLMAD
jgi:hypothetical protein